MRITKRTKNKDHYIELANEIHGSIYDYALLAEYPGYTKKVEIKCPEHGSFFQTLANHITKGAGCPSCGKVSRAKNTMKGAEYYKQKAIEVHAGTYTYDEWPPDVYYEETAPIRCAVHGIFHQRISDHIAKKAGCPKCSRLESARKLTVTKRAHIPSESQGKLSDYNWLYEQHIVNQRTLEDISRELGCGDLLVGRHCHALGVPVKRHAISAGERALLDFVQSLIGKNNAVSNDRSTIAPRELDILVPSLNIAFEYCGLYWHSELHKSNHYHLEKQLACGDHNTRLITIFEDEWVTRRNIVEQKIAQILGKSTSPTVFARKCKVIELTREEKNTFFNDNHIQGTGPGSITYGLQSQGVLVAAMTFIKQGTTFTLNRFATSLNVPGGFSKLLAHFKRCHDWSEIVSFADRRWSEGGVYEKNNFKLDKVLAPDYYYTDGKQRFHKFNFRHKNLPKVLGELYDPDLSETENMAKSKFVRIWNCGLLRYVQTNSNPNDNVSCEYMDNNK